MANYLVTNPWHGVELGDVVEMEKVHPALRYSVKLLPEKEAEKPKTKAKPEAK